ncbi:MAG: hypothetical protein IKG14_03325 [Clostridia bacterium]|nr:hypothetical protein [Clostridia bacterium]
MERNKKIKKVNLNEMGITLVALVVTIIVLLILAGVTISLVLGDNGVIGRAQYASNMWANATKDEYKTLQEMSNEVSRLSGGGSSAGGNTGTTIHVNGTDISTISDLSTHYGELTDFTSVAGVTWDLFYDDADNYYLIASDYVPGNTLPNELVTTEQTTSYCAYFSTETWDGSSYVYVGTIMDNTPWSNGTTSTTVTGNPLTNKYLKWVNSSLVSTTNNPGMKAVAYMMDTTKWSNFAGGVDGAYAIGGPPLEMFVNSYNAKHDTKLGTYGTSASDITSTNANECGYKVKLGNDSWDIYCEGLDTSGTGGNTWVRTGDDKAYAYWLASTGATYEEPLFIGLFRIFRFRCRWTV